MLWEYEGRLGRQAGSVSPGELKWEAQKVTVAWDAKPNTQLDNKPVVLSGKLSTAQAMTHCTEFPLVPCLNPSPLVLGLKFGYWKGSVCIDPFLRKWKGVGFLELLSFYLQFYYTLDLSAQLSHNLHIFLIFSVWCHIPTLMDICCCLCLCLRRGVWI